MHYEFMLQSDVHAQQYNLCHTMHEQFGNQSFKLEQVQKQKTSHTFNYALWLKAVQMKVILGHTLLVTLLTCFGDTIKKLNK